MEKSESIAKLSAALVKAQGEMPSVKMNKTNPFLKNRYADLGAIIETAQPILLKNGLAISQLCTSFDGYVGVETMLIHSSGEWISTSLELPTGVEKGKSTSQIAGSIITYLRRYSFAAVMNMYADEDGDGNEPQTTKKEVPVKNNDNHVIPVTVVEQAKTVYDAVDLIESYVLSTPGLGAVVMPIILKFIPNWQEVDVNDIDSKIVTSLVEELTGKKYEVKE